MADDRESNENPVRSTPFQSRVVEPVEAHENPGFGAPGKPDEIGTLGHFRILKELGHGGMGAVYLAFDERLQRKVALKVMLPNFAANKAATERFLREARTAATLEHEHIVTIFEADTCNGIPYIAMQLLKGLPLDQYLAKNSGTTWQQAVRIGREIALGLTVAHHVGVVHRDIKPANIWIESPKGRVKLLDFGLAKVIRDEFDGKATAAGRPVGTPAYMSPEQARGDDIDFRSDLFSLGVVVYQIATGRRPFPGTDILSVFTALAMDEPKNVREINPDIPEPLAQLLVELLAKKPDHRPESAHAVFARLTEIRKGIAAAISLRVTAGPPSTGDLSAAPADTPTAAETVSIPAAMQPPRKNRRTLWSGMAAVAVLAVGTVFALRERPTPIPEPTPVAKIEEPPSAPAPVPTRPERRNEPDARGRKPVPTRDEIQAERMVLHNPAAQKDWPTFPAAAKLKIAKQLLQRGPTTTDDARSYAELELAAEFAGEAGEVPTVLGAATALAQRFAVADPMALRGDALVRMSQGIPPAGRRAFAIQLVIAGIEAIAAEDGELAERLAAAAGRHTGVDVTDWLDCQVALLADEAKTLRAGKDWVRPFEATLKDRPNDAVAKLHLGEYLGLVRHDWEKARELIEAAGETGPTRQAVANENAVKDWKTWTAAALKDAGDAWWAVADAAAPALQLPARRRAKYWYLKAATAVYRPRWEIRFKDIGGWWPLQVMPVPHPETMAALPRETITRMQSVPTRPVTLLIGLHDVDGHHALRIGGGGVSTTGSSWGTREVTINQYKWPHPVKHNNGGAGWLLPSELDFSTARVTNLALDNGRAGAWYVAQPGALDLVVYDTPSGASSFTVQVSFEADGYVRSDPYDECWAVSAYAIAEPLRKKTIEEQLAELPNLKPVQTTQHRTLDFHSTYPMGQENGVVPFLPAAMSKNHYGLWAKAKWTLPAGEYEVRSQYDDGIRVDIDDRPILNDVYSRKPNVKPFRLTAGSHDISVRLLQLDRQSFLRFWLRRVGP